jgi:hypothetical protein
MTLAFAAMLTLALIGAAIVLGVTEILCRGAVTLYRRWRVQKDLHDVYTRTRLTQSATVVPRVRDRGIR